MDLNKKDLKSSLKVQKKIDLEKYWELVYPVWLNSIKGVDWLIELVSWVNPSTISRQSWIITKRFKLDSFSKFEYIMTKDLISILFEILLQDRWKGYKFIRVYNQEQELICYIEINDELIKSLRLSIENRLNFNKWGTA